ncbi:unnamed protein product, partial [Staurois parvus]
MPPVSATCQCRRPLVPPISDLNFCISVQHHQFLLINANQCRLISAAYPCHLISAHQCCLSVQPHQRTSV